MEEGHEGELVGHAGGVVKTALQSANVQRGLWERYERVFACSFVVKMVYVLKRIEEQKIEIPP